MNQPRTGDVLVHGGQRFAARSPPLEAAAAPGAAPAPRGGDNRGQTEGIRCWLLLGAARGFFLLAGGARGFFLPAGGARGLFVGWLRNLLRRC